MLFRAGPDFFQTENIAYIRRIVQRAGEGEPVQYSVYLTGQARGVDVVGDDLPPFEAWIQRELLRSEAECRPTTKAPESKSDAKKVA